MRTAAEILRWTLIALQAYLVYWMLRTKLWRHLPLWTAWIACEAVSRVPFQVSGWYAHHFWRPLQPALMFLLGAAAIEARWQAGSHPRAVFLYALAVVPIGCILPLPQLIVMRTWTAAVVCVWLALTYAASDTARWHVRLLAAVAGAMAMLGWMPGSSHDALWWQMRAAFLAIDCAACVAWIALFNRRDAALAPPDTAVG